MYLEQSGFHTHGDCVNFSSGFCILNGVVVDPSGAACPNFTPKSSTSRPQIRNSYHPPYIPLLSTRYEYRTHHSFVPISSAPTAPRQSGASFLCMSGGRRGGGRGGAGRGKGRGRLGGFAAGPGGSCVCPRCGYSTSHVIGTPCYQQTCPKCGNRMTRGS